MRDCQEGNGKFKRRGIDLSVGQTALYRTSSHTPDLFFKKNSSPLLTTPLPLWYSTYNYVNVREAHTP